MTKLHLSFHDFLVDKVLQMALLLVNFIINKLNHLLDHMSHNLFDGFLNFILNNTVDVVVFFEVFKLAWSRPSFFSSFLESAVPVNAYQTLWRVPRGSEDAFSICEETIIICKQFCPRSRNLDCFISVL